MPVESMVGPFEVSYSAFSAILLRRGVPICVVYGGNNVIFTWSHDGLAHRVDDAITEQLDDDGACPVTPVLYLQLASPVLMLTFSGRVILQTLYAHLQIFTTTHHPSCTEI